MKKIIAFLFITVIAVCFFTLALDAAGREADWRQDRLCQYYSAEINAYARRNGEMTPC